MEIEDLLIEGISIGEAFGEITNNELDISCSDEELLNQNYALEIYKTDEELEKQERIGRIDMTYMDIYMAGEMGYDVSMVFDLIDSEKQGVYRYLFNDNEPNTKYVGMDLDVIYIDKIFIEEKYRNKYINELEMRIRIK